MGRRPGYEVSIGLCMTLWISENYKSIIGIAE